MLQVSILSPKPFLLRGVTSKVEAASNLFLSQLAPPPVHRRARTSRVAPRCFHRAVLHQAHARERVSLRPGIRPSFCSSLHAYLVPIPSCPCGSLSSGRIRRTAPHLQTCSCSRIKCHRGCIRVRYTASYRKSGTTDNVRRGGGGSRRCWRGDRR